MSRHPRWSPLARVSARVRDRLRRLRRLDSRARRPSSARCQRRPHRARPPARTPPASAAPRTPAMVYPATAVDCAEAAPTRLHRRVQPDQGRRRADGRVRPVHARTSRSSSKVAFASIGIQDSRLARRPRCRTRAYVQTSRTAPGRTCSRSGSRATTSPSWPTRTTGAPRPWRRPRSRAGAPRPPSGCRSSRPAPSTASTTRHRRLRDDQGRHRRCTLYPARGAQHPVHRHERHRGAVGQREGPPGDRHGHRPRADRRQLLPGRVGGRRLLHPVRHPARLRAATSGYDFDAGRGQAAADGRRLRLQQDLRLLTTGPKVRSYLPNPTRRRARTSRPSSRPTWASTIDHRSSRSRARSSTTRQRASSPACSSSAGARTIRTRPTSWTTTSASAPARSSARSSTTSRRAPDQGAARGRRDRAGRDYDQANNLHQAARPDGPARPRRLGDRLQGGRHRALMRRRSATSIFSVMKPGDRDQLVSMQNAEPLGLYCGDETRRRGASRLRAGLRVALRLQGRRHRHRARPRDRVRPEHRLARPGPARSATASSSTTAPTFDANDVVDVVRRPVGRQEPAPRRQRRHVRLLPGPVRRASSTRRPVRKPSAVTTPTGASPSRGAPASSSGA